MKMPGPGGQKESCIVKMQMAGRQEEEDDFEAIARSAAA